MKPPNIYLRNFFCKDFQIDRQQTFCHSFRIISAGFKPGLCRDDFIMVILLRERQRLFDRNNKGSRKESEVVGFFVFSQ